MSWQFVFKHVTFTFHKMEDAGNYAFRGGYNFFEWNGVVFFINEVIGEETVVSFLDTGINSADLF